MPAARRGAITGASKINLISSTNDSTAIATTTTPLTDNGSITGMSFHFSTPSSSTGGFSTNLASAPAAPGFGLSSPAPGNTGSPAPTMFSFGNPTPAPLATGGFGAPAPTTGVFSFGNPAPTAGGVSFGNPAPAPAATGSFGGPEPAKGSFFFGNPPANSSTGPLGAPSPTTGGTSFGNLAPSAIGAPAPATIGAYGAPATQFSLPGFNTAPASSLFGSTASSLAFAGNASSQPAAATTSMPQPSLAGNIPYVALPPDQKLVIDMLYEALMQHKRSILAVSIMAPTLLEKHTQQADAAAGRATPLTLSVSEMTSRAQELSHNLKMSREMAQKSYIDHDVLAFQSTVYAKWPVELVPGAGNAHTPVVALVSKDKELAQDMELERRLHAMLDHITAQTDQVMRMPSPYLWQLLNDMESRFDDLLRHLKTREQFLEDEKYSPAEDRTIVSVAHRHERTLHDKLDHMIQRVHQKVDQLRKLYAGVERGVNVLDVEHQREIADQRSLALEVAIMNTKELKPAATTSAPATGSFFGSSSPVHSGGLFGSTGTPAPFSFSAKSTSAPGTSIFGTTTPAATPAAGGVAFGVGIPAPTPLASSGSVFGTPSTGTLFGKTGGPSHTFGSTSSTSATAASSGAAPSFPAFGAASSTLNPLHSNSSSSSTPKSKNKSRSTRNRR